MGDEPKLPSTSPPSDKRCSPVEAAEAAKLILGSYPKRSANDPVIYLRQVAAALEGEPVNAVRRMIDPKLGLVANHPFLPTLSEIRDFLRPDPDPGGYRYRQERRERETAAQLRERNASAIEDKSERIRQADWDWLKGEMAKAADALTGDVPRNMHTNPDGTRVMICRQDR